MALTRKPIVTDEPMQSLFAGQAQQSMVPQGEMPVEPQGLQMQPGDKMDPNEAMRIIQEQFAAKATGPKLTEGKDGQLGTRVPVNQPLMALLGMKKDRPVSSPDFLDTMKDLIGEEETAKVLPKGLPQKPDGTPFVSQNIYEQILSKYGHKKKDEEKGSPFLAKALIAKASNSGVPTNVLAPIIEHLEKHPPKTNQLGDLEKIFTEWKDTDIVKAEDGRTYLYDRRTQTRKPFLDNAQGLIAEMNPLEIRIFEQRTKAYDNDPVIKENRKSIDLINNASALLESNNPASVGVLFSNIAKSIGKEVGVLTEGDIARAVGDPGWGAQLHRWYNKRADVLNGKGQLSDKDLKDFRGLFTDIAESANKRFDNVTESHVKRTAAMLPGIPVNRIRDAMKAEVNYAPAEERRLPGQSTKNVETKTAGVTKSGVKFKVIP